MDRSKSFDYLKVATYPFWDVYLSRNQNPSIGTLYAWLKRPGDLQYATELGKDELAEFFESVLPSCESAIAECWNFQRLQLALPEDPRYHAHAYWVMVPRRGRSVRVAGFLFDEQAVFPQGVTYCPRGERVPKHLLLKIRDALSGKFPQERRIIRG
ncbi:hypothetical protein HY091_01675 [Candidatus Kaiserbacteria bacterium]|nr:hypothetical protein [Candidatus Kaiserbacteria bacterium]